MPLPDLTRLDAAPAYLAGALAERLREVGFCRAHVDGLTELLPGLPTGLQHQGLDWLTLDERRPASMAMRLLMLGRTLALADARELLGAALLQPLIEVGLLAQGQHGVRFPLRLELVNQLMIVSDHHDDDPATVMAVGGSTQLLARASYPQTDIHTALDLGCGSGLLALLLAPACRRVVGIDINPRALHLARFNAGLNGIANVEWRQGHLFEPVAGDRFDLIVSQPPFLPRPDDQAAVLYLHGGTHGDELALALLARAGNHLEPAGMAVVLSNFPVLPAPLLQRLRQAVPEGGLLVIQLHPPAAASTLATLYGGADEAAAHRTLALHRHLQALGITELVQAVVVLHGGAGPLLVTVDGDNWPALHRSDIDNVLSGRSNLGQLPAGGGLAQSQA